MASITNAEHIVERKHTPQPLDLLQHYEPENSGPRHSTRARNI